MSIREFLDAFNDTCTPSGHNSFSWSRKGQGNGDFGFYVENGIPYIANELISRQQMKDMICRLIDESVLDCPSRWDGDGTPGQDRLITGIREDGTYPNENN